MTSPWRKIVARNCFPLTWFMHGTSEMEGLTFGPLWWRRTETLIIKRRTQLGYVFGKDPYYESNFAEFIGIENPDIDAICNTLIAEIRNDLTLVPGHSKKELEFLYARHRRAFQIMVMGYDIIADVRKRFADIVSVDVFERLDPYLTTPRYTTLFQGEHIEIEKGKRRLGKAPEELPVIADALAETFGFLHDDHKGRTWTPEDYRKILQTPAQANAEDASPDLSELSAYEIWLVELARTIVYIFDDAKNAMIRAHWGMRGTLRTLSLDENVILNLTEEEFYRWLADGFLPPEEEIRKRDTCFAFYAKGTTVSVLSGCDAVDALIREQGITEFDAIEQPREFRGCTAQKGKVQGKARIVFTYQDAEALESGEILVASMTTPELLAGMYKAAAFVTDEGGVTCHAAIVAREMKKPCIIATKIATKALKNGDLVEVDATAGIVRILEG